MGPQPALKQTAPQVNDHGDSDAALLQKKSRPGGLLQRPAWEGARIQGLDSLIVQAGLQDLHHFSKRISNACAPCGGLGHVERSEQFAVSGTNAS